MAYRAVRRGISFAHVRKAVAGLPCENGLARFEPCPVGRRIVPAAPLDVKLGRHCSPRSNSRTSGLQADCVLVLLLQAFRYCRGQFNGGRRLFDPFCALIFGLEFRDFALHPTLELAAEAVIVNALTTARPERSRGIFMW